jgi:putative ABC transport system permease protein
MLLYYVNLAFRNLRNKTGFYAINIAGLAIGLAACLLITHYVRFHRSFDTYQPDSERIYRILYSRWSEGGGDLVEFASATPIIGRALKENIPEIEMQGQAFRLEGVYSYHDKAFDEKRAFYAETDLLTLLGVVIRKGKKESVLDRPATAILSTAAAERYFGDESPIGKIIEHNYSQKFEIVAVFENMPPNTHFKADMFLSMETWKQQVPDLFQQGYIYSGFFNYIKLREGTDPELINQKAAEYVEREYSEALAEGKIMMGFKLQPLEDIHLHSHLMHEIEQNSDASSVRFLEIVAWFILIIAWVNFFNLSTIISIKRIREITIRKVNGASRRQLVTQLLTESAIINILAILLALLLFESIAPTFFGFSDLPDNTPVWNQTWVYLLLIFAFIVGTLSSGVYNVTGIPTSRLNEMLKGASMGIKGKRTTRKLLVTLQFFIAIGLIAATTVIYSQYRLISHTPLGFRLENMMVVNAPLISDSLSYQKFQTMKRELQQVAEIEGAAFSSVIPGKPNMYNRGGVYLYGSEHTSGKNYRVTEVDRNFIDVFGIRIIHGENFTDNDLTNRFKVLLNENGALWMGFTDTKDAIGQKIVLEHETYTIAGIIDDFHQLSPKETIEPQIFRLPRRHKGYLTLATSNTKPDIAIEKARKTYMDFFPGSPFDYFFLKDFYNAQNLEEKRFGLVFLLFSILVIIITILGLMGLSAYTAEQKKKEIGIRKILGASPMNIFSLMFKEYIVLWALGAVVALPMVYFLIEKWLNSFALRINPGYWFYTTPLTLVLFVALATVFLQSWKVLMLNPAENIRAD